MGFTVIFLTSCKPTATINKGQHLLNKNAIKSNKKEISKEGINSYIKQKPNRKILGLFRFHLGVYNIGSKPFPYDIEKKLRNTPIVYRYVDNILSFDSVYKYNLRTIIGEAPIVLDTNLTKASTSQIKLYLQSKGYFNSEVKYDIEYKNKKAKVTYLINAPKPYIIDSVNYVVNDPILKTIVWANSKKSSLKKGDVYDIDNFEKERNRITSTLKKQGYYLFSKDYIKFSVDTNLNENHKMNIKVIIGDFIIRHNKDSISQTSHKRFKINNIYILPDYFASLENNKEIDTTIFETKRKKSYTNKRIYYFIHKGKLNIKPAIITQSIFINPGEYFNIDDVNLTYNRLSELRNFRRITILFEEVKPDSNNISEEYFLNCKILLPSALQQSISFEAEGTNTGGNLGVGGNIQYENKNIFGGAEIFNFKINSQIAIQKVFGESKEQDISTLLPFNTIEAGGEARITLPKFLIPINPLRFSKSFRPKTSINAGYNYQKRPDYTRYIANAAFGYEWRESITKKHLLIPLELNLVKIFPSDAFKQRINAIQNIKIRNTYRDHLITTSRWNFIKNTQPVSKRGSFMYFKAGVESAGFLMRLGNIVFNSAKKDDSYSILGVKYTQFIRTDLDYRYYKKTGKIGQIATRLFFGIGIPYGNVKELPFEKSFYVGGANSLRAWKLKTLGPGSYADPTNSNLFERIGDMSFEANIEYRFPLYSFLNGAFFIDAGNVWLIKPNTEFEGGTFKFNNALNEIAIGTGLGVRFDFSFFIVRFDAGIPVKDPAQPENRRWMIKDFSIDRIVGNIGIGYPF